MPRRFFRLLLSLLALLWLLLTPSTTRPHGGGIDRFGCHHDRKAGNYHCHQGPLKGQVFASQSDMLAALQQGPVRSAKPPSLTSEFSGRVVRVLDGDTIEVMHVGLAERIRLNGIDCPEKGQAYGTRAKQFTSEMVFGKDVTVKAHGLDKYGRTIGDVMLADGTNLNQELVKAGLAWWYRKYSTDESLRALEEEARTAKRGLWANPNPIPPWDWRKLRRG